MGKEEAAKRKARYAEMDRKKRERAEREKLEEEARIKREKQGKPWIKEVDEKEAEEFIAQPPRKRQESDSCIREVTRKPRGSSRKAALRATTSRRRRRKTK